MANIFDEAVSAAKKAHKVLVVSHVSPEGDAVGSLLGMALALRNAGKDVTAYLEDPVPDLFRFLPGADTVVHDLDGKGPFDATVAVDCGQKERLGKGFVELNKQNGHGVLINIDHHATNDRFGAINVIVDDASSAGELVYDFCMAAGFEITKGIAVNLYVAIHTDTGSFRYSSATASAFTKAGDLVRRGVEPWDIARRVYETVPARKYELLAMVLATLEIIDMGGAGSIATLAVTLDMFKKVAADKDYADGFVNYARSIEGVSVGMLLREASPNLYKVSLRSKGDVDVSEISLGFGGGGHRNAAGFTLAGTFEEVRTRVLDVIRARMNKA